MSTRPVLPVDPAGNTTDRLGPHSQQNAGPPGYAAPIIEPVPEGYAVPHVFPYSDTLNWPAVVAEMAKPTTSAALMAGQRWITERNVIADPDGLETIYDQVQQAYVPIPNMALYVGNYVRHANLETAAPQGVKMSALANRFSHFLRQVQNTLVGSP